MNHVWLVTRFMAVNPLVLVKQKTGRLQCSQVTSTDIPISNLKGYFGRERAEASMTNEKIIVWA